MEPASSASHDPTQPSQPSCSSKVPRWGGGGGQGTLLPVPAVESLPTRTSQSPASAHCRTAAPPPPSPGTGGMEAHCLKDHIPLAALGGGGGCNTDESQ